MLHNIQVPSERAIHDTIYGMMMLLDGIPRLDIDEGYRVEYVLTAHIRGIQEDGEVEVVEAIELAPGGDGLCIGFHYWFPGDEADADT